MTIQGTMQRPLPMSPFLASNGQEGVFGRLLRNQLAIDVDRAIGVDTVPVHEAVCRVLARHIGEPDLLDGLSCLGSSRGYTRHVLHTGPGYSVLALVWLPGQASPAHARRAWCAFGVHQGELVETCMVCTVSVLTGRAELRPTGCRQYAAGAVSGGAADAAGYHRLANLGAVSAVSIHVYGIGADRLGTDLNRVWVG